MQFRLPEQLQTELLAYDPKLKALARQSQPKTATKKAKHPHGNMNDLIPFNVVRASLQQDASDIINGNPAPARFHAFSKLVDVATPQARRITHAVLYHYEQCWYAAWLPPQGQKNDYLYGYAVAFKDTATAAKTVPLKFWNHRETYETKQYGRTTFYKRTELVTKEDIINGNTERNWHAPNVCSYYQKSSDLYHAVKHFEEELLATIPRWEDTSSIFERICTKHIYQVMHFPKDMHLEFGSDWVPTVDEMFAKEQRIRQLVGQEGAYARNEYRKFLVVKPILDTPFFRRWMQEKYTAAINAFNDPATTKKKDITKHFSCVLALAEKIHYVNEIWPDCPIDFYQSNLDALLGTAFRDNLPQISFAKEWLREHMPVASFFQMLNKFHDKAAEEAKRNNHFYSITEYGVHVFSFQHWNDTLSMLERIIKKFKDNNETFTPPKRWRIEEFHDYVQAESWKITNPNEGLPQDLFPEPIKVDLDGQSWSFFQPHDTHQLALWGQAVRNCVGSASHYAEACKKKKHFLVLCMLDGKPQFTIQLNVEMGMMSVQQIVGLSNQRLSQEQKDQYTKAFGLALQSREATLKS